MSRRGSFVCGLAVACSGAREPAMPSPRGDILLVTIETTRADHVGPLYGHRRATFPKLSARAASGRVYTRAFSASSWTLPSIVSIYTGLSPLQHTVDRIERQLPQLDRPRLGHALEDRGYEVAFFGVNPVFTVDRGLAADGAHWQAEVGWPAGQVNQAVFGWLEQRSNPQKPLFLHVHYFDPHCPYIPPARALQQLTPPESAPDRAASQHAGTPQGLPAKVPAERYPELGGCYGLRQEDGSPELDLAVYRHRYDGELRSVDEALDRLLVRLAERGIGGPNDLVVVTSDHGEAFWEHDDYGHSHTLWGETTWVPLVVWGAGTGTSSEPVGLVGLYGSLLAHAGVSAEPTLSSATAFSQGTRAGGSPWMAWVTKGTKWMSDGQRAWVSDLRTDPLDAHTQPAEMTVPPALQAQLNAAAPPAPLQPTEEELQRLRALGYTL